MQTSKNSQNIEKEYQQIQSQINDESNPTLRQQKQQIQIQRTFSYQSLKVMNQISRIQAYFQQSLRQKQRNINILQNEIQYQTQQKVYQFHVNQRLQQQLRKLQKTSDNFKSSRYVTSEQFVLSQELQKLKQQFFECKKVLDKNKKTNKTLKKQQNLLREDLRMAFKRRRQIMLGKSNKKVQSNNNGKNNQSFDQNLSISRQRYDMYLEENQINKKRIHSVKGNMQKQQGQIKVKQYSQKYSQKQLLVKLFHEFQELKLKVDQNIKQKNKKTKKIKQIK